MKKKPILKTIGMLMIIACLAVSQTPASDGTYLFRLTVYGWTSWSPPYTEIKTYICKIRQGDILTAPESRDLTARLIDFPDRDTARFALEGDLELIGQDNLRKGKVDTILVSYEDVCLGTPSYDAGTNYCLRIDSMYKSAIPYDTLPRFLEVDEDPKEWVFHRKSAYESGKLREEWDEKYDDEMILKKDGEDLRYDQNGQVILEMNYNMGVPDGAYTTWFADGQIKLKGQYVDGLKEGYWQHWDTLGREIGYEDYDMGTGSIEIFYPDGKRRSYENFTEGKRDSVWELYYENGNIHFRKYFDNGREVGTWEFYDPEGELDWTTEMPGGSKHPPQYWYKTGILRYETKDGILRMYYKNGRMEIEKPEMGDGTYTTWYSNGQKKEEGLIAKGQKEGPWRKWDSKGNLTEEIIYQDGRPIPQNQ